MAQILHFDKPIPATAKAMKAFTQACLAARELGDFKKEYSKNGLFCVMITLWDDSSICIQRSFWGKSAADRVVFETRCIVECTDEAIKHTLEEIDDEGNGPDAA